MRSLRRAGALAGAALALSFGAVALAQQGPSLTVSDATVDQGSDTITIPSFTLAEPGYVVVHEGTASEFGAVIGHTDLMDAGSYSDQEITLDRELEDGEYLWPMLHTEGNNNQQYDSVQEDPPVTDTAGGNANANNVVAFPMQVTVQQGGGGAPTGTATPTSTAPQVGTPGPAGAGNAGLIGGDGGGASLLGIAFLVAAAVGGALVARRALA